MNNILEMESAEIELLIDSSMKRKNENKYGNSVCGEIRWMRS